MASKRWIVPVLGLALGTALDAGADWREQAQKAGLDAAEIARLGQAELLVAGPAYQQVFDPYLGELPVFVTSDALLNAFHVLLEASLRGLERGQAARGMRSCCTPGRTRWP
jgi:hypothetical protein